VSNAQWELNPSVKNSEETDDFNSFNLSLTVLIQKIIEDLFTLFGKEKLKDYKKAIGLSFIVDLIGSIRV